MTVLIRRGMLLFVCGVLQGCGEDSNPSNATSGPTTASGSTTTSSSSSSSSSGSGGAAATSVTARFVTYDGRLAESPATGTAVALDAAGTRVEKMVDADGRVVFEDVDFSMGDVAIIGALEGHGFAAQVGLEPDSGEILLFLPVTPSKDLVTISGVASNAVDPSDFLGVTTSVSQMGFFGTGPNYALKVPKGEPFTMVALDSAIGTDPVSIQGYSQILHQWTTATSPAVTANTKLDLDFAQSLVAHPFSGSFPVVVPNDNVLAVSGNGFVYIHQSALNSLPILGDVTKIDISADGTSFEYDGEYVDVPGMEPLTIYAQQSESSFSGAVVLGNPTDGAQNVVLPAPPKKTTPGAIAFGETFMWELPYQDDSVRVDVRIYAGNGAFSYVYFPPGATQGALPKLPTAVSASTLFGPTPGLKATLGFCSVVMLAKVWCEKGAGGPPFDVDP